MKEYNDSEPFTLPHKTTLAAQNLSRSVRNSALNIANFPQNTKAKISKD